MKKKRKRQKSSNEKRSSLVTYNRINRKSVKRVTRYLDVKRSALIDFSNRLRLLRSSAVDTSYLPRSLPPRVIPTSVSISRQRDVSTLYSLGSRRFAVVPAKKCRYKIADDVRRSNFFRAKRLGYSTARPAHNRIHERIC